MRRGDIKLQYKDVSRKLEGVQSQVTQFSKAHRLLYSISMLAGVSVLSLAIKRFGFARLRKFYFISKLVTSRAVHNAVSPNHAESERR